MQVPNYLNVLTAVALLFAPSMMNAQQISREEKTAAIQTIATHVAKNYVYPEKGGQIASHIQTANHKGQFASAANWQDFAEQVTKAMRSFSNDHHLYVKYDPAQVKQINSATNNKNRMYVADENSAETKSGLADVRILQKNTGYIKFTQLNINEQTLPEIKKAMQTVENTDALIIDLRDNGGGGSTVGAVFESYFLPSGTPLLEFTSRNGDVRKMSAVNWLQEKKYEKPVYIIINKKTASAAEAFAFVLQKNRRAQIVGEPSAGAAFMNDWFTVDDHCYVSVSTSVPNLPGTDISWEGEGVRPDIKIRNGDAIQVALDRIK